MPRSSKLALASAILALSTPIVAQEPLAPASPAATKSVPDGAAARRICRSIVPTGSMMPKRFCLTAADWREFNGLNQQDADTALRRRGTGMCDISCQ